MESFSLHLVCAFKFFFKSSTTKKHFVYARRHQSQLSYCSGEESHTEGGVTISSTKRTLKDLVNIMVRSYFRPTILKLVSQSLSYCYQAVRRSGGEGGGVFAVFN